MIKRGLLRVRAYLRTKCFLSSIAVLSIASLMLASSSCARYENDKDALVAEITSVKARGRKRINLYQRFGKDWDVVCIQTPYMSQSRFEEITKTKVTGYEELSDDSYNILWFINKNDEIAVKIHRINHADYFPLNGPPCVNPKYGALIVVAQDDIRKFFLFDNRS